MNSKIKLVYGSSLHQGARAYQEDCCYWLQTAKSGCMGFVLSDGMGGHAAGDVASHTLVKAYQQVFSKELDGEDWATPLKSSLDLGNQQLKEMVQVKPELDGMGATYLAGFVCNKKLYWISVGDSPLYLFSDGKLTQINEDHSMAPVLQERVKKGELTQDEANTHPQRNSLLSAVMGDSIDTIDQPSSGISLNTGDVMIAASDGIQTLSENEIETLVHRWLEATPDADLTDILLKAVLNKKNPRQDNISIMVAALIPTISQEPETADEVSWSSLMRNEVAKKTDFLEGTSAFKKFIVKWVLLAIIVLIMGVVTYVNKESFFNSGSIDTTLDSQHLEDKPNSNSNPNTPSIEVSEPPQNFEVKNDEQPEKKVINSEEKLDESLKKEN